MKAKFIGTGSYLPVRRITNDDLAKTVDTSDEWIVQRTGIRARHLLEKNELPSDMGVAAGRRALESAGVTPDSIDLLVVATNFPDMVCPGSAPFIAEGLGLGQTPFFDLTAGCTGFVYAAATAEGLIRGGAFQRIMVVGLEALSRVTDWADRRTCVLFGDGAGAAILEVGEDETGILGSAIFGDPSKALLLHTPAGGTRTPASEETVREGGHYLKMEGSGVFRNAVPMMEGATHAALEKAGLSLSDVDWIIPHQANLRIIDALVQRLGVDEKRVIVNLDEVANTSTASIPIAFDEALRTGKIQAGDLVAMTAFGAGVTYGAIIVRV